MDFMDLPEHIWLNLLREWLFVEEVVALDSAECRAHFRQRLLSLFRSDGAEFICSGSKVVDLQACLFWCVKRGIRIGSIGLKRPVIFFSVPPGSLCKVHDMTVDFGDGIVETGVCYLVKRTPLLTRVTVCHTGRHSELLRQLGQYCPMLTQVELRKCDKCSANATAAIKPLFTGCPNMQVFIAELPLGNDNFARIARNWRGLRELRALGDTDSAIDRKNICAVVKACSELRVLQVECEGLVGEPADAVDGSVLQLVAARLPHITELIFSDESDPFPLSALFAACKRLRILSVQAHTLDDAALHCMLTSLPQLESVFLLNSGNLCTGDSLPEAGATASSGLKRLHLFDFPTLTSEGLGRALSYMPCLRELVVTLCPHMQASLMHAVVRHCGAMRELGFVNTGIDDAEARGILQEGAFITTPEFFSLELLLDDEEDD